MQLVFLLLALLLLDYSLLEVFLGLVEAFYLLLQREDALLVVRLHQVELLLLFLLLLLKLPLHDLQLLHPLLAHQLQLPPLILQGDLLLLYLELLLVQLLQGLCLHLLQHLQPLRLLLVQLGLPQLHLRVQLTVLLLEMVLHLFVAALEELSVSLQEGHFLQVGVSRVGVCVFLFLELLQEEGVLPLPPLQLLVLLLKRTQLVPLQLVQHHQSLLLLLVQLRLLRRNLPLPLSYPRIVLFLVEGNLSFEVRLGLLHRLFFLLQ